MIVKLSQGNSVSGMVNYHFDKGKEVNKILFLNHLPSEPKAMIAKLQEQNALNTHKSTKRKITILVSILTKRIIRAMLY